MGDQSDTDSEEKRLILQNKQEVVLSEIQRLVSEVEEEARRDEMRLCEKKQRWHKERAANAFIGFCRHGFGLDKKRLAKLLENQEHFSVFLDLVLKRATKNSFLHRIFYTPIGVLLIPIGIGLWVLHMEYMREMGKDKEGFTDESAFVRSFGRFQKYGGSVDEFYQALKDALRN